MNRAELVDKLETVSPGLADSEETIHGKFWFTGRDLIAYNDQIGISVPLATEFSGAVPRHTLKLLSAYGVDEIKFKPSRDELRVEAGRGHFQVPTLGPDSFTGIFEMPKSKQQKLKDNDKKEFLEALNVCMRSVSDDLARPEYMGITVQPAGNRLSFYSTNSKTISHTRINGSSWPDIRSAVLLPSLFCKQAVKLLARDEEVSFGVHPDHVLMSTKDGIKLFGRLIENARPIDFDGVFDRHFPEDRENDLIPIPDVFGNVMQRADIITDVNGETPRTRFTVKNKVLEVHSHTANRGEARDEIRDFKQKDVQITTTPKLVRDGVDSFKQILFTESCVVMAHTEKEQYYLVAASGGRS